MRKSTMFMTAVWLTLAVTANPLLSAASQTESALFATVTDDAGQLVTGLESQHFAVFENDELRAHDFDFLHGSWKVQNRMRKERLKGSNEWWEFSATLEVRPILDGQGNVDQFKATIGNTYLEGVTLRLFHPKTKQWSLHWVADVGTRFQKCPDIRLGRQSHDGIADAAGGRLQKRTRRILRG